MHCGPIQRSLIQIRRQTLKRPGRPSVYLWRKFKEVIEFRSIVTAFTIIDRRGAGPI
jgi:hypothetical protein